MATELPEWITIAKVGEGTVEIEGETRTYYVLSRELEPRLRGFLGFWNKQALFVSEDVPPEWVPYVLAHEVMEYTHFDGQGGRCRTALVRELALVPEADLPRYLPWRRDFFRALVGFYFGTENEGFKREIAASLAHLEERCARLSA